MSAPLDVLVFFSFRSPYCYLATHKMWALEEEHGARIVFKALGGYDGRSPPERARVKIPLVRQDVARWAKRMGVGFKPPPPTTDPTKAALGALLADELGLLKPWVNAVMEKEWAEGQDIGDDAVLCALAAEVGIDEDELQASFDCLARSAQLEANTKQAQALGVIGVPTFVIGDQIFWGQDRLDFVFEHLAELGR